MIESVKRPKHPIVNRRFYISSLRLILLFVIAEISSKTQDTPGF